MLHSHLEVDRQGGFLMRQPRLTPTQSRKALKSWTTLGLALERPLCLSYRN